MLINNAARHVQQVVKASSLEEDEYFQIIIQYFDLYSYQNKQWLIHNLKANSIGTVVLPMLLS